MTNDDVADRLAEVARLLAEQEANPFRVRAWRNAGAAIRALPVPVVEIHRDEGPAGLERIHGVGPAIARALGDLLTLGHLPMLERLRGEADPVHLLATVPGIGPGLAERLHHELGIDTLEALELAAHDGRLDAMAGFGPKRVAGVQAALGARLGRAATRGAPQGPAPPIGELLDVDREYREGADAATLPRIAPRRFNPRHQAWLPVLHTRRGTRHYTVLYSNTALAHRLGRTRDWVVIYSDGPRETRQATVVTAHGGSLDGRRVIRGRESECEAHYFGRQGPPLRRPA